ncbi:LIM-domain binding protein-domain-containing protein [Pisolithus sp. B1]|nr:LIM-domain binding protein-domain-containing protein [Pisolithus sp. B1]
MPPMPSVSAPHFLPQQQQPRQQQQPPNHMNLMAHANNPPMSLLGGGAQTNPNSLPMSSQRYQIPQQNTLQQGQNPQINPSAAPPGSAHMSALGSLSGMPIQSHIPANGIQVRRTQSHPQGLNQSVGHVPTMIPSQQAINNMNMAMNPQGSLSGQLRQPGQPPMMPRLQGPIPGSMSPDILGRQPNPSGVPQGSLRPGSQTQLMNSLAQPSNLQQAVQQSNAQNAFQQSVHHPHHSSSLTSSPRPGMHPQQHPSANMMMSAHGPSQASGRPMGHGENAFVGPSNPQLPASMMPGSTRIPNNSTTFPFGPPVPQNDSMEMSQSIGDGLANAANPPQIRPGFQPASTQQFEQQADTFSSHFNIQSQGNAPPTRPPSHPSSVHGNSIPRSMQPPSQHSPRQSDPMTGHIQQQPQRPQSQPQGPPGRPPSQTGPSHTPRTSQSQLPPSALVPTRMPSQTQPQASPLQQRQSPSVQPPIAPRPPQGPSTNAVPMNPTASDPGASQPQPTVMPRPHVMAPPLGFGQGCIRLLQFSGQLSSEGPDSSRQKHTLQFWENLVRDYFTSRAVMKITLWKDNQRVEAKPLEIGYSILPRFFLVTTQSGVKSMTLSLDGARERLVDQTHAVVECVTAVWTYKYTNGYTVTLRGPLTVHILLYPVTGSSPTTPQQFQSLLKIAHFQFDANMHEKFISLDAITGSRMIEPPKTPRTRNNPTPSPNGALGAHRTEEDRQGEEHRVLINNASIPGEPVNAFGIPQVTMRCLELAEGVSQMTELIAFAKETNQGPREALKQLAHKIREYGNGALPGSMNGQGGSQGYGAAVFPQSSPPVTLYHSMSATPMHPGPSGSSPRSAPPSADAPQKQSKPHTSGQAPPPNQPPAPSQAGLTPTSLTGATSLKRKPSDTHSSPTTANAEPQSKRTRKGSKRHG